MIATRRFDLFSIFGFPIRIDLSWFIIATLIVWSLATGYFPANYRDLTPASYWWMGVIGAIGLFVSVLLHELAHALVARRFGLRIRSITLFIFGGVAEMDREPPHPQAEFMVAAAGPLASVAIGFASLIAGVATPFFGAPIQFLGVLSYLFMINIVLAIFNLVPAFPLDGGRILRSILWLWRKNFRWATLITSQIGAGFGVFLIALGIFRALATGSLISGIWLALIGMFLRNAAKASYKQVQIRSSLEGEPVARFMKTEPVTVPRSISIADLVEHYVYRYHQKHFPVVDDERLLGFVTTERVKQLAREEWDRLSVGAIVEPCSTENTVSPDTDAMAALALMSRTDASRLMIAADGRLVGEITLEDLLQFLALKGELEGEPPPTTTGSDA